MPDDREKEYCTHSKQAVTDTHTIKVGQHKQVDGCVASDKTDVCECVSGYRVSDVRTGHVMAQAASYRVGERLANFSPLLCLCHFPFLHTEKWVELRQYGVILG